MLSKPSDWIYFSEGGKHAIFACGDLVLRIEKNSLAQAATNYEALASDVYELKTSPPSGSWVYAIGSVIDRCYFDQTQQLLLPTAFCARLYHYAISSGCIPPARLKSWQTNNNEHGKPNGSEECFKAHILRNYTRLKLRSPGSISKAVQPITISVEIKPKAGYLTHSPLVLPKHRCKYYRSKYDLQQELMEKSILTKGWLKEASSTESKFKRSYYCPLNLFSGDFVRLKGAVAELSKNMQNNFRVWCNGVKLFGENESSRTVEYEEVLNKLLNAHDCNGHNYDARSTILETVVRVTATVLHRETFLRDLLSIQQSFDIIDGDGAVLIYQRLIALYGGSQTIAEDALEQQYTSLGDVLDESLSNSYQASLCSFAPSHMPNCSHLHGLIDETRQFKCLIERQRKAGLSVDDATANRYHSSCTAHVQNLPEESCIYLLTKWLLSLTFCDISFFVTFNLLSVKDMDITHEEGLIECNQSAGKEGLFVCEFDDMALVSKALVQYEIKVIDYDPKPVTKLRNRVNVEKLYGFCE